MSARDDYPLPEGPTARSAQRRNMLDEIEHLRLVIEMLRLRLQIVARSRAAIDRENQRLRSVLSRLVETIDEDDDNVSPFLDALSAAKDVLGIVHCNCHDDGEVLDQRDCRVHGGEGPW